MAEILELDTHVETKRQNVEKIHSQIHVILKALRPDWKEGEIEIIELVGGLINNVYSASSQSHPGDIIAVKVYLEGSASLLDHEGGEYELLKFLSQHSTDIMQLYCKFENGRVYKFFPGRLISVDEICEDSHRRKLYETLHKIHAVQLPEHMDKGVLEFDGSRVMIEKSLVLLGSDAAQWLDDDDDIKAVDSSKKDLVKIAKECLDEYKTLKRTHPLVLCHGDPRQHNTIINEDNDVHLIDWDVVGVSVEIWDLANTLARDPELSLKEHKLRPEQNPELMDKWLMMYLETHPKYKEKPVGKGVFMEWRKLLLRTLEILVKMQATIYAALAVQFHDHDVFHWTQIVADSIESIPVYRKMRKEMEVKKAAKDGAGPAERK